MVILAPLGRASYLYPVLYRHQIATLSLRLVLLDAGRTLNVYKTFKMCSEGLMYVQFKSCVQWGSKNIIVRAIPAYSE